ncbi:MAG: PAS domain S-box protein [Tunicatimonas sp.]
MKEPRSPLSGPIATKQHQRSLSRALTTSQISYLMRLDLSGNYTYVNQAFEDAFGPKEHFVGKPYAPTVHPEDVGICQQAGHDMMENPEKLVVFDIRKPKRDGNYYLTRWEISAVIDPQGTVVESQAIGYDIFQKRTAEEAKTALLQEAQRLNQELQTSQENLLKSEKKFRSLIEHSFDAIIVYDQEGIIIYAAPSAESVIGYSPDELVGTSGCSYTFSEDEPIALKLLDDALAHPEVRISGEMRLARKDGRIIWVETALTNLLHDEDVMGVVSNFRDVTGQRQGKQAVAEYSKRLELATQSANIGIWDWHIPENRLMWDTRASNILGLNSAYSAFYKESIPEVIDTWLEIIHPDDQDRVRRSMEDALQSAESFTVEYRVVRPDNHQERYVKIYAKILREDKPVRMTGAIRDTTGINTTEQQLRHNIEALQKTNAELDQFVYSTSHNLRAPLSSVLGLVSILQGENDHAEREHFLQLIETSIHRLDSTISSIIDYSRNTRLEVAGEPVNFREIIDETIDSLYFLLHAVNVRVTTRLPDTISFATDAHRLKVIISNLLSNSIKYFNPQAVQPWVDIIVDTTEEGVLVLVEDNGIGIPGAMQDKIFDMFFRASEQSSGSGLGLYIVRETVHTLGGTISMTSQVGKGSTFTVALPSLANRA